MAKKQDEPNESQQPGPYQPPPWGWAYLNACLDVEIKPTDTARAEAAGIDRSTVWAARQRPGFTEWLEENIQRHIGSEHRQVRQGLLRKCIMGDPECIKLWHELYAGFIPTQKHIGVVSDDLDPDELAAGLDNRRLAKVLTLLAGGTAKGSGETVN